MANPFEQIPGDRGGSERMECPKCNGTGVIRVQGKDQTCDKCRGKGTK